MCCKTKVTDVWDFNLVVHIVAHIDQRVRPTGASSVASHVMLACCGSTMCCYSQFSFSSILLLLRSTFCLFLMGFIYGSIEGLLLCHPGVLPNSDPQNCVPCFLSLAFLLLTASLFHIVDWLSQKTLSSTIWHDGFTFSTEVNTRVLLHPSCCLASCLWLKESHLNWWNQTSSSKSTTQHQHVSWLLQRFAEALWEFSGHTVQACVVFCC